MKTCAVRPPLAISLSIVTTGTSSSVRRQVGGRRRRSGSSRSRCCKRLGFGFGFGFSFGCCCAFALLSFTFTFSFTFIRRRGWAFGRVAARLIPYLLVALTLDDLFGSLQQSVISVFSFGSRKRIVILCHGHGHVRALPNFSCKYGLNDFLRWRFLHACKCASPPVEECL